MSDGRRAASAPPPVAKIVGPVEPAQPFVAPRSRWSRIRPSGWEIALWAFGIVLVIASIQANVTAIESQYFGGNASGCVDEACLIYTQSMVMLSPGAFAAGLISVALAIAIRAIKSLGSSAAAATDHGVPSHAPAGAPSHAPAEPQSAAPTHTTVPANQPTPAFPPTPPTFLTPPVPTAPGAARPARSQTENAPSAAGPGPIAPSSQPDRINPVPVTPVRGAIPPRPPATTPRRRAEVDHSIYMRPTSTPSTGATSQPKSEDSDAARQDH